MRHRQTAPALSSLAVHGRQLSLLLTTDIDGLILTVKANRPVEQAYIIRR